MEKCLVNPSPSRIFVTHRRKIDSYIRNWLNLCPEYYWPEMYRLVVNVLPNIASSRGI